MSCSLILVFVGTFTALDPMTGERKRVEVNVGMQMRGIDDAGRVEESCWVVARAKDERWKRGGWGGCQEGVEMEERGKRKTFEAGVCLATQTRSSQVKPGRVQGRSVHARSSGQSAHP